jgi:hypothetical protein
MDVNELTRCRPAVHLRNIADLRVEHPREADLIDCIQRVAKSSWQFVSPGLKVRGLIGRSDHQGKLTWKGGA